MEVISNTASETAPLAILSLEKTRVLAIETLNSLLDSRCTSHPQYDPETDMSAKKLTKVLINTDKLLRDLDHHLLDLIGSGASGHGALADWIGYQWRVGYLPDPADIIDDRETIESWLTKIKNKLSTVPDLSHPSLPVPRLGTVVQEPDRPPLTPTSVLLPPASNTAATRNSGDMVSVTDKPSHPDGSLLDDYILPQPGC